MADLIQMQSAGGQLSKALVAVAGTSGGNVICTAVPGRMCKIVVTSAGTGASLTFYDSATTNAGTVVYVTAATTQTLGTVTDINIPLANGLVVNGTTGTPGLLVTFNKDTVYGR